MAPHAVALAELAIPYLERQVWFHRSTAGQPPAPLELLACDTLRDRPPGLTRLLLGRGARRYQLLCGWRPATDVGHLLTGRESSLFGSIDDGGRHLLVYDALADDALLLELLGVVTGGRERAARVRRVSTLVSHSSLVFDERLFMKCYRVLEEGPRPEAEMMFRLDAVGFNALLAPVARWREHGYDLAIVREFLPSALEGRLLALTSLRDLLAHAHAGDEAATAPVTEADLDAESAAAGGDFSSEMRRLGATTAGLHAALHAAFGSQPAKPAALAALLRSAGGGMLTAAADEVAALGESGAGVAIRLHGDYHLRRVMRAESGWLIAGFADDPLYAERRPGPSLAPRIGSPLEDLADMCFSLHRVAAEALAQRPASEEELAAGLAAAWERRNRAAFLEGYVTSAGARRMLPPSTATTDLLLGAFEDVRRRRYEATPSEE